MQGLGILKVVLELLLVILLGILVVLVAVDIALNFGWVGVILAALPIVMLMFLAPRFLRRMFYQVKEGTAIVIRFVV
jgi:membrane protein YdbS with pleckstrin-like domain